MNCGSFIIKHENIANKYMYELMLMSNAIVIHQISFIGYFSCLSAKSMDMRSIATVDNPIGRAKRTFLYHRCCSSHKILIKENCFYERQTEERLLI